MTRLPLGRRDGGVARFERRTLREYERVQTRLARLDVENDVASVRAADCEGTIIPRGEYRENLFDHRCHSSISFASPPMRA
jgi:hypothetical protein